MTMLDFVSARAEQGAHDDSGAYVFTGRISDDQVDSYYTWMDESSLRNFAAGAAAGVTLLDSHNWRNLGYGQSVDGRFDPERMETMARFRVIPGINYAGGLTFASTDDLIRAIEGEAVRDMSVGFMASRYTCDICGASYYSHECRHYAGLEYELEDGSTVLSTVQISDARLYEVSVVYAGANPNAGILRKLGERGAQELTPKQRSLLEDRYRMLLRHSWQGATITTEDDDMPMEQIRELLGVESDEQAVDQVRELVDIRSQLDDAQAEVADLRQLAEAGRQYRADLIEQALAEGVRAMGQAFPREAYQETFESAPLETVRRIRDSFAATAAKRLPGGRQVDDQPGEETPAETNQRRPVPASAFRA